MIEENDPRLTSFVLGELSDSEMSEMSSAVAASEDLQRVVAEIRQATSMLDQVFEQERPLQLNDRQKSRLNLALADNLSRPRMAVAGASGRRPSPLFQQRWMPWAVAAAAFALLVGGALYRTEPGSPRLVAEANPTDDATQLTAEIEGEAAGEGDDIVASKVAEATELMDIGGRERLATRSKSGEPIADSPKEESWFGAVPSPNTAFQKGGGPGSRPELASQSAATGAGGGVGGKQGGVELPAMDRRYQFNDSSSQFKPAPGNAVDPSMELAMRQQAIPLQAVIPAEMDLLPASEDALQRDEQAVISPEPGRAADPSVSVPDGGTVLLGGISRPLSNDVEGLSRPALDADEMTEPRKALIESTRKLIADAGLASLDLQVEVRDQPVTQELQTPTTRYVQQQQSRLIDGEDGTNRNETFIVYVPVQVNVPRMETINVVSPYVLLDDEQAQRIVGQLAYNLDPEAQRTLSFEQLIGVDGLVLDSAASPIPEMKLAERKSADKDQAERGRFSAIQKKGTSFDLAAISLARALNRQVTMQSPAAEQPLGELAQSAAAGAVLQESAIEPGKPADLPVVTNSIEIGKQPDETRAPAVAGSIPLTPKSLEEVDFSGLIRQLKQVLEQRNRELGSSNR